MIARLQCFLACFPFPHLPQFPQTRCHPWLSFTPMEPLQPASIPANLLPVGKGAHTPVSWRSRNVRLDIVTAQADGTVPPRYWLLARLINCRFCSVLYSNRNPDDGVGPPVSLLAEKSSLQIEMIPQCVHYRE